MINYEELYGKRILEFERSQIIAGKRESFPKLLEQRRKKLLRMEGQKLYGDILDLLTESGRSWTLGELADYFRMSNSRMNTLLMNMRETGMVTKEKGPDDLHIGLSGRGRRNEAQYVYYV